MAFIELKNATRVYQSGDHILKALDGIHLKLEEGKFVVVLGPSGAGKKCWPPPKTFAPPIAAF